MARNGSGTYNLPSGQPVVTGTVIDSTVHNALATDLATAMTNSLAKNGETTPTANLPMGGFKHTGVADASARTHYASAAQVQDSTATYLSTVGGTVDAITGSPTIAVAAYAAGQRFVFLPSGTNTGATTINVGGLGVKSIVKGVAGSALAAGDLILNAPALIVYNGTAFYLLNPGTSATGLANPTGTIGLAAVNGTAVTAIRSDGAPALSQAIAPTWSGQHIWSLALRAPDGSAGTPSYSFTSDTNTGIYNVGADVIGFSAGGTARAQLYGTALEMLNSCRIYSVDGDVSGPGVAFSLDPDTGFYRSNTNEFAIATGGTRRAVIYSSGFQLDTGAFFAPNGSASPPSYSFIDDTNSGMYSVAADQLGFATGGTLKFSVGTNTTVESGQLQVQNGDASAPGYAFENETDTGFYLSAANDIAMSLGGTGYPVGFRGMPQRSASGSSNTAATDNGRAVIYTGSGGHTFTVDSDFGTADNLMVIINAGSASLAIAESLSGTMSWFNGGGSLSTGSRTLAVGGVATVYMQSATAAYIWGIGIT